MSKRTFIDLTCREEYSTSHKRVCLLEEDPIKEGFFQDIDIESVLSEIDPEWAKMFPVISVNE